MFDWLTGWIEEGGSLGVGLLMLAENVFPPIPSELIMPMAGYLASIGRLHWLAVVVAGVVGSVLGAWFWYWLGRALGRERLLWLIARWGHWATITTGETEATLRWFEKRGEWAVASCPQTRTVARGPVAFKYCREVGSKVGDRACALTSSAAGGSMSTGSRGGAEDGPLPREKAVAHLPSWISLSWM